MPSVSSLRQSPAPDVPCPSNPVLVATQSQWIFSDAELHRSPSVLDGMPIEAEHTSRSKGVNFITQVGILLKLPQLTLCTASVYLHRFFMRYSMVDLPQRPGMHPYSIAATALFLATKVEENCRKMRELIIACCRVALKQPSLVVDEQSKEFWKWRDTILHNEDLLLEALCFDLQLEQPYRLLYDFLCHFRVQDNKQLRNSAWAFVNDSTFTVLCVQFTARTIAASALYAGARYCDVTFEDDRLGRPWWEQIEVDLKEIRRACNRIAEIYENHSLPKPGQKYPAGPIDEDEATDKTRKLNRERNGGDNIRNGDKPHAITNGRQYDGEDGSQHQQSPGSGQRTPGTTASNGATVTSTTGQETSERSPKRQRRSDSFEKGAGLASSSSQQQQPNNTSSQESITNATSAIDISNPDSQAAPVPVPEPAPACTHDNKPPQDSNTNTNTNSNSNRNTPEAPDQKPSSPPSSSKPNSRIPAQANANASSRVPASYQQQQQQQRMEHPLPPPPPVSIPPLPHDNQGTPHKG